MPSKRARKIPEKIQVSRDDLNELQNSNEASSQNVPEDKTEVNVSIDELKEQETQDASNVSETSDQ